MMRIPAAFVQAEQPENQALLLTHYEEQLYNLGRSLRHLAGADLPATVASVQDFVQIAEAICDPRQILPYFRPLLDCLELQQSGVKDWRRMSRAAREMATAAAAAGLSKRQVGRLRRYAEALDLIARSHVCTMAMERVQGEIEAKVERYDDLTAAERRDLGRDVQLLDQHLRGDRQRWLEIRRTLMPPTRGPSRPPRMRRSRRAPRRAIARRVQSDSGGDGDGDGGSDPPPLRFHSADARFERPSGTAPTGRGDL